MVSISNPYNVPKMLKDLEDTINETYSWFTKHLSEAESIEEKKTLLSLIKNHIFNIEMSLEELKHDFIKEVDLEVDIEEVKKTLTE
jgi:competence transcription factor ComK